MIRLTFFRPEMTDEEIQKAIDSIYDGGPSPADGGL